MDEPRFFGYLFIFVLIFYRRSNSCEKSRAQTKKNMIRKEPNRQLSDQSNFISSYQIFSDKLQQRRLPRGETDKCAQRKCADQRCISIFAGNALIPRFENGQGYTSKMESARDMSYFVTIILQITG